MNKHSKAHRRPLFERIIDVPARFFAQPQPRPTAAPETVSSVSDVVFTRAPGPRLQTAPAPAQRQSITPVTGRGAALQGNLALKRPWPKATPENLFREDFRV